MAKAWVEASKELGFDFVSPYTLQSEGKEITVTGYLPDFGSPNGAVILGAQDPDEADVLVEKLNMYYSGLNPERYEIYSRETFINTLCEWGWFSTNKQPPAWYK